MEDYLRERYGNAAAGNGGDSPSTSLDNGSKSASTVAKKHKKRKKKKREQYEYGGRGGDGVGSRISGRSSGSRSNGIIPVKKKAISLVVHDDEVDFMPPANHSGAPVDDMTLLTTRSTTVPATEGGEEGEHFAVAREEERVHAARFRVIGTVNTQTDDSISPPRRARHDSPDLSPPRRARHDSPDLSPPRRIRHDSPDLSPPRQGATSSAPWTGAAAASANSAAATAARSAPDLSPPRRTRTSSHSPPAANTFPPFDDAVAGATSTATVHRDAQGRRLDPKLERLRQREEQLKKDQVAEKNMRWGRGLAQTDEAVERAREDAQVAAAAFARFDDDTRMNDMLRNEVRADDPMAAYIAEQNRQGGGAKEGPQRPVYRGPAPPPNRFKIAPGHRWDGRDRSNGFERTYFQREARRRADSHAARMRGASGL